MRLAWPVAGTTLLVLAAACSSFGSDDGTSGGATTDGGLDGAVLPPGAPPPPGGGCAVADLVANPPTTDDCNGQQLDLTTSKNNCGRCGHACDTSCAAGACVAFNTYNDPTRIDLRVYEVTGGKAYMSTGAELRRVDTTGANMEVLATVADHPGYAVRAYAYDGTKLYTLARNVNATMIGLAGLDDAGQRTVVPLDTSGSLAAHDLVNAGDSLFTASYGGVVAVTKAGGAEAVAYAGQPGASVEGPVAQGGDVIWIEASSAGDAGPRYIVHVRTAAGDFSPRADEDGTPAGLAVDDAYIYWTEPDAQVVLRADRRTQDPPEIIARWPSDLPFVKAFALDADHVYWVAGKIPDAGDQDNVIYAAPKCAGAGDQVTVVARPGAAFGGGLAADGTHVFFTGTAGLWQVSK